MKTAADIRRALTGKYGHKINPEIVEELARDLAQALREGSQPGPTQPPFDVGWMDSWVNAVARPMTGAVDMGSSSSDEVTLGAAREILDPRLHRAGGAASTNATTSSSTGAANRSGQAKAPISVVWLARS